MSKTTFLYRLRSVIRNRYLRISIVVTVILATFTLFGYHIVTHPQTLDSLFSLHPFTILVLFVAYILTIIANAFVLWSSLKIIRKPMSFFENIALTGYSSIVNFFGPLQSGPGFRAAYLKKKHGVTIKSFFYLTILFYLLFAAINIAIACIGAVVAFEIPVLVVIGSVAAVAGIAILLLRFNPRVVNFLHAIHLSDKYVWYIGLGALLLTAATALAYFTELIHVDSTTSFWQAIVYTAVANLALFVSLTPGAIGFRESFLVISQQIHGISADVIVAANIIDRAFYVIFLLILFAVLLLVGFSRRGKTNATKN